MPHQLTQGQHLFTKDGRRGTNAIIVAVSGDAIHIETDFGNKATLTPREVDERYYLTGRTGTRQVSSVEDWRRDRLYAQEPGANPDKRPAHALRDLGDPSEMVGKRVAAVAVADETDLLIRFTDGTYIALVASQSDDTVSIETVGYDLRPGAPGLSRRAYDDFGRTIGELLDFHGFLPEGWEDAHHAKLQERAEAARVQERANKQRQLEQLQKELGQDVTPRPIKERLEEHYRFGIRYHELICLVFPDPDSHRPSSNGGPPGCAMAFGKALRRHGYRHDSDTRVIYKITTEK